jgi:hypothetical protein
VPGAEREQPLQLGVEVGDAQVEVHPVLAGLPLRHLLEQQLQAVAVGGQQLPVRPRRARRRPGVAQRAGPELGGPVQVGAVEHHQQDHVGPPPEPHRPSLHAGTLVPARRTTMSALHAADDAHR